MSNSQPSTLNAQRSMLNARGSSLNAPASAILRVEGHGVPLRGDDIDTDRIMPARFLRAVSFEGLERHVFEDDRAADPRHPFEDARYRGAAILIVNGNFGCGSSREHAPQGLARFGIRAIVGESFSEIFQGNAAMIGVPCFAADHASIDRLQAQVERTPDVRIDADVRSGAVTAGSLRIATTIPAAFRDAFLSGQWNPTAMLLDRFEEVRAVARRLPYLANWGIG
jgi:3-isopropylmalate/(R)-2-methylmalate dehydratase small subunit